MKKKLNMILSCVALVALFAVTAFAADRDTPRVEFATSVVTAAETIPAGWIVGTRNGYGYKYLASSTNLVCIGISQNSTVSNETLYARSGIFGLKNNGAVTQAYTGSSAYVATNNTGYTVGISGAGTSIGKFIRIDDEYAWVRLGL